MHKKSTPYCFGISKSIPRWPLIFYNTIRCGDVVDTFMHRTVFFAVEQLISLCCRVGTRNRSIISMVREERVVSLRVLTSLAFWCTSQGVARVCQSFRLQLRWWCFVHKLFLPCHTDMYVPEQNRRDHLRSFLDDGSHGVISILSP